MCEPPPPWDYTFYEDVVRGATYSPDKSGNRTDGSASLDNDRLHSMTGADGRLYTFEYDDEGRVISKGASGYSQTYGWNDLGQLIWVKTNGDSVAFGYDAAGRRVRKYHAGTVTGYLWDGDNLLMELDGGGNRVLQYTYEPGVDRPYSVKAGGNTYYYQLDQTGSVIGVWNTSNSKVDSYTYDPFGYTVASSGSFAQPLRWKGREFDAETGLYYMRARYYDPTVGRFISEDPIGIAAGVNPYTFADGDPVNRVDPTGMCGKTALVWQHYFENPSDNYYEVLAVWYDSDGCGKGDGGGGGGTGASAGPKAPHCSEALVAAGNSLADLSLSLGSYSSGMTAGGLALAVVFPEVAASGWALAEAGGYLGLASAGSQVGSGIMHGLGGAGWSNALNGTTSIAAAYVFGKFFATPNTAGYKTRSQRNWIKSMEKAEAIAGGLFDLITGVNPNAGAKQASCSP
jgi:RHS repeat-associated protein